MRRLSKNGDKQNDANLQIICQFTNCEYNMKSFNKLIHPELSYKITGVLFAVHNELGRFRNEKEYGDAIETHLKKFNIGYEREKKIDIRNTVDFLIENKVILEIKVKRLLTKEEYYQIKRYLVALNKKSGLLVNFRDKYIKPKRILNSLVET